MQHIDHPEIHIFLLGMVQLFLSSKYLQDCVTQALITMPTFFVLGMTLDLEVDHSSPFLAALRSGSTSDGGAKPIVNGRVSYSGYKSY